MTSDDRLAYLRGMFRHYADIDFPAASAPLYASIASEICADNEVLSTIETLPGQPAANLLFAAVHYLLLSGAEHPLREYYADIVPAPRPLEGAGAAFRDFCLTHRASLEGLVRTRMVQTNVLERCGSLLPAFGAAAEMLDAEALAMIEVGTSAGLNLLWDRYRYEYSDGSSWGDNAAPVRLLIEVRGEGLSLPDPELRAAWRTGIDLNPVDLGDGDSLLWQRALMWPERLDRQQRLAAAAPILREVAPTIECGDACDLLPDLLHEAPGGLGLVVFASYALYQFPAEARDRLTAILVEHSQRRRLAFVTMDTQTIGDAFGTIDLSLYESEAVTTRTLATTHPHGAWIEWLDAPE